MTQALDNTAACDHSAYRSSILTQPFFLRVDRAVSRACSGRGSASVGNVGASCGLAAKFQPMAVLFSPLESTASMRKAARRTINLQSNCFSPVGAGVRNWKQVHGFAARRFISQLSGCPADTDPCANYGNGDICRILYHRCASHKSWCAR